VASGNMLLCRFRVDDDLVWNLLTNHNPGKVANDTTSRLHASILMAGQCHRDDVTTSWLFDTM
jgi:flagellar transcriptional activator FlhD